MSVASLSLMLDIRTGTVRAMSIVTSAGSISVRGGILVLPVDGLGATEPTLEAAFEECRRNLAAAAPCFGQPGDVLRDALDAELERTS